MRAKKFFIAAAFPLGIFAVLLAVWYVAAATTNSEFIVPSPSRTVREFASLFSSALFYRSLFSTLLRSLAAYLVSLVLAIALALLSVFCDCARRLLSPLVSCLRALPTMAVTLLLAIWVGAKAAPIVVALMVVLPTLYAAIYEAFVGVDRDVLDIAKIDGASNARLAFFFYLPLSVPSVSHSVAGGAALTIKLMVAAEVLAYTAGSLGAMMQTSRVYFETAQLMALTACAVIVALAAEKIVLSLLRLCYIKWK